MDLFQLLAPLLVLDRIVHGRLLCLEIVGLAEDEHDHVGVLLDRTRFTKVGEDGTLVITVIDAARQLR